MAERLDEERIEILRSWGAGLASDPREELRAAGKAITVLIDEIDRLHVDLWSGRVDGLRPVDGEAPTHVVEPVAVAPPGPGLRERLTLKRHPA